MKPKFDLAKVVPQNKPEHDKPVIGEVLDGKVVDQVDGSDVIYASPGITITKARLYAGSAVYSVKHINSVKMGITQPRERWVALVAAAFFALISYLLFKESWYAGFAPLLGVAVSLAMAYSVKTSYHVVITTSSGEVNVFSAKDQAVISKITSAISVAIE